MKQLPIKSHNFQYIEQSFKAWLETLGYAPNTVYQMPNYVRELFYYLEQEQITHIKQITTQKIKSYYQTLKYRSHTRQSGALSNGYLNKHLQALYKFMDYLRQTGKIELPYLALDREDDNTKAIQVLKISQIQALYKATELHPNTPMWEAIAARDRAMLSIFYSCGLRRNEGYHLDLSDINFDRQILHIRYGKNYKERFVPFNTTNAKILEDYIYNHRPYFQNAKQLEALFIGVKGYRMQGQSLAQRLKLLQQRTDDIELHTQDVSLHTLRHSIATHLLKAGMSLERIAQFLGHKSLESTQIYTHLIEEKEEL